MVCVGRNLKDNLVPMLLLWTGQFLLEQVAHSSIWLEHLQGWGIHNFSGQLVLGPHHSHSQEFLPDFLPKPLFLFKAVAPCPVTPYSGKSSHSICHVGSLQVLEG